MFFASCTSEKTLVFIRYLHETRYSIKVIESTGGILCSALPRGIRGREKSFPVDNCNLR
jgi:hypothetical protein